MKFQSICLWGIYCPLWGSKSPPSPQESEILEEAAEAAAFCGSNISTILDLKGFYPPQGKQRLSKTIHWVCLFLLLEIQPPVPQSNRKNHIHFHRDFITSVLAWERHLRPALSKKVHFAGFFFM